MDLGARLDVNFGVRLERDEECYSCSVGDVVVVQYRVHEKNKLDVYELR